MGSIFSRPEEKAVAQRISESQSTAPDVDVVIVGGGPTGLFTGLLLHRLGISVRILGEYHSVLKYTTPKPPVIFMN